MIFHLPDSVIPAGVTSALAALQYKSNTSKAELTSSDAVESQ